MTQIRILLSFAVVLVAALNFGCGLSCTPGYAPSGFVLVFKTPAGVPIEDFTGTASWNGRTESFECRSGFSDSSEQTRCHVTELGSVQIVVDDPPSAAEVTVNAVNAEGAFTGTVQLPEPTVQELNGLGCGETRLTTAVVTLQ